MNQETVHSNEGTSTPPRPAPTATLGGSVRLTECRERYTVAAANLMSTLDVLRDEVVEMIAHARRMQ